MKAKIANVKDALPAVIAEAFRLSAKDALVAEAVRRILSVGTARKIVLFGSRARGDHRPDSDIDLLVIEEKSDLPRYKRSTPYRMALLGLDIDIDVEVWTPEEIADWAAAPRAFITTILREGKVLYEGRR